jgi:hypothetical protein
MDRLSIAIGITISLAIVICSLTLLIIGYRCYYGYNTLADNNKGCQDIYISGILMTFLIGCVFAFYLLCKFIDCIEGVEGKKEVKVKNPVRRKSAVVSSV